MALPGRGPLGFPGFPSDPDFDRGFRTVKRAGAGIGCFVIVSWLFGIALTVGAIAVAWHFIAKFW